MFVDEIVLDDGGHARSGAEADRALCPARKYISPEAGVIPRKRAGQIYFRAGHRVDGTSKSP